jgi:hypothetical protein
MMCLRCDGVMIYDKFYGSHDLFWGWRCVICGEIVDQVILMNRRLVKMGRMPDTRSKKSRGIRYAKN